MRTIGNWEDMRSYGVMYLTGESCSYGRRLLCDLTEKGARSVARFFELNPKSDPASLFADNWNHGEADDPHVASIMLPRFGFLEELAVFCALDQGAAAVVVRGEGPITVFESDRDIDEVGWDRKSWWISEDCKYGSLRGCRIYTSVGRNEHQMSGRVA